MKTVKKVCFKCNKEKVITDFYKHKRMADGHLNKCSSCCKKEAKEREEKLRQNPEWVEKERERGREKYYRLGYREKHKPTYEQRKLAMKRYAEKYPEKINAKVKSNRLKPKIKGNHLHHWSYNEEHYKDVIELSVQDHNTIHRHIIYDQERMMYRVAVELGQWKVGTLLDTREKSESYYNELLFKKQ